MILSGGLSAYNYLAHQGVPPVLQAVAVAALLLLSAGFVVRKQLAVANGGVLPDEGVTLRNVFELILDMLISLSRDIMGPDWKSYFPVVAGIFFFILVSNLLGLVPGLGGGSSFPEFTFAWGTIAFLVYNFVGIKKHGLHYIYQFMGPSLFHLHIGKTTFHVRMLAPLFLPLEIVLHFARIITLGIRLLANMFADHLVVAMFTGMVPLLVPAIFMGLGAMVAFLQAFVFALLTMIYIGAALEEAH